MSGHEHCVPLSGAVMEIIEKQAAIRHGDFVFPGIDGERAGQHSMRRALQQLGRADLAVHGFRSSFSDWVAESTSFLSEVREMRLGHAAGDKVEAAYRRDDLFEKRRQLAERWAQFCTMTSTDRATPSVA
jgi:integrase